VISWYERTTRGGRRRLVVGSEQHAADNLTRIDHVAAARWNIVVAGAHVATSFTRSAAREAIRALKGKVPS
jgi:hypothetical protein